MYNFVLRFHRHWLIFLFCQLWDVVKGDEAMQIVEGMDSAEDIASCLLQTATSSTLCADNVTVVVACL